MYCAFDTCCDTSSRILHEAMIQLLADVEWIVLCEASGQYSKLLPYPAKAAHAHERLKKLPFNNGALIDPNSSWWSQT